MRDGKSFAVLVGIVRDELEFSHEVEGEKFYKTVLQVKRKSGIVDEVPVEVSERTSGYEFMVEGCFVGITGDVRTRNIDEDGRRKLHVCVFIDEVLPAEEDKGVNEVGFTGTICREVHLKERDNRWKIADMMLAVNRVCGKKIKNYYIPCIAFGRNAEYVSNLPIGTTLEIEGRFQSRKYNKKMENGEGLELKTAYEVAIRKLVEVKGYD